MHLERLIAVLEAVAIAGRVVSPAEVQRATAIPRPTCYRLLQTLAEHRLLDVPAVASGYLIGERLKRMTLLSQCVGDVSQAAAPILAETAIEFGEAVFLSRFRRRTVEIICVETPVDSARSFIHPGLGRRPLHACSCSQAIAAFTDEAFQDVILSGPLRAYTTKTQSGEIERELAAVRDCGYAECVELSVATEKIGATLIEVADQIAVNFQLATHRF